MDNKVVFGARYLSKEVSESSQEGCEEHRSISDPRCVQMPKFLVSPLPIKAPSSLGVPIAKTQKEERVVILCHIEPHRAVSMASQCYFTMQALGIRHRVFCMVNFAVEIRSSEMEVDAAR
jgi:hypothetical protein